MDFEQDSPNDYQQPPYTPPPLAKPKRKTSIWKILGRIIFALSIIANVILLMALVGASVALLGTGRTDVFTEKIIEPGPAQNKIAIIKLHGVINRELAEDIREQIKTARDDKNVKALIISTFSPGGSVFASDQIHYEILSTRMLTKKPVVAYMEGLAASGGYYTSVACDKIIAEPTTITGSIGVILGHFVLQELLEDKLGIKPVVIKSGPKKDWPSSFEPVTDEQVEYLHDKIIDPAYDRFVKLVAQGRPELSLTQTIELADGSIYTADQAVENKLIDQIGYQPDAIKLAKSLAGIEQARVIEYQRPFSFSSLFGFNSKTLLNLDSKILHDLTTPQLLYLWTIDQ